MAIAFPDTLDIPAPVLTIARTLERAGHEAWVVGGAIRDALLGHSIADAELIDLATSATPQQVRTLFRRTVPVGIEHGTVAVLDPDGRLHEVTTFRRDVKTDGRHAVVEFGVSLEDDLARRDFTINAIAYHPLSHDWRDPFGGARDLEAGVVRAVGEPRARFREDYLRILRALRFTARFGFTIDGPTWDGARAEVEGLRHLSAERVRDEWFKGLVTAREPADLCRLWCEVGATRAWMPAAERAAASVQPGALAPLGRDPVLITSFLSADPAKTLRVLKCSNAEIERGRRIGEYRLHAPDPADAIAVRRWLAAVGPGADDLMAIAEAEGHGGELRSAVDRARASGAPIALGDLAVSGDDLLALGVPRGPEVGRLLDALLDEVLERPERNEASFLLARARELDGLAEDAPEATADQAGGDRRRGPGKRRR